MGLRKILTDKDPALHKVCKPVEKFDWRLHKLLDDMRDTLIDSEGVGLAAPQVGILRRVVLVDTGEEILELVNPVLIETDGEQVGPEGCLSVPGKYGLVKRPYYAKVRAQDRNGDWYEAEGEELIGRCFCHELDHLDGILELVNPVLIETDGEQIGAEGCLSVPGKYGLVKRPYYAKVRAQDRNGEWFEAEGEELIGRCFCHELDHLDGIVYTEVMERFLTEEELQYDEE